MLTDERHGEQSEEQLAKEGSEKRNAGEEIVIREDREVDDGTAIISKKSNHE